MSTLIELRDARMNKLNELKKLRIDPFPATSYKNIENKLVIDEFEKHKGKEVIVAGRIISIRGHGMLSFIDLKDQSGKIQLYIKQENLKKGSSDGEQLEFDNIGLLDVGDFLEAKGFVTKTKRGEISIEVASLRLLTKSLRPLPDKWDGLKDKETRFRRRYLDTNVNKEVFDRFLRRSKFWEAHRDFFKQNEFVEINIPILEHVTGGADANPFITHFDALDQDFYLRISQELYLKRLIGGGYEKVYEIGPRFRNEGMSDEHLPEHIAMEFYWAYSDYKSGMQFIQELFRYVYDRTYGKLQFKVNGYEVDLKKEWEIIDYEKIIKEKFDIDVYNPDLNRIKKILRKNKIHFEENINVNRGIDSLWKIIRKTIGGPAFMINEPKFLSPLAKSSATNQEITERFHPIIAGSELGNGFSELNDPLDQIDRFVMQQKLREGGDKEAQMLDIDFVEMLEYGMPPTFGYGHSERNFWVFENQSAKECVPFPPLKSEISLETKVIYPEIFKS